jgi:murein DD-endopeptidase MepM/ murein hydrolase activator NlpD
VAVGAGDSVEAMAARFGIPVEDLVEANGLREWEPVREGSQLFVPDPRGTVWVEMDEAFAAARRRSVTLGSGPPGQRGTVGPGSTGVTAGAGSAGPGGALEPAPPPGAMLFPVPSGQLASRFGWRNGRPHDGIDILAPEGTPILAAHDGEVIYSGDRVRGYGRLVILRRDDGVLTLYGHCRENLVSEGQRVVRGQVIALVGRTGNASGSHLHFEVRVNEQPDDPDGYLGISRQ